MRTLTVPVFLCHYLMTGTVSAAGLTPEQQQALASPPASVTQEIERFLPRLLSWYDKAETGLLPQGRALNPAEMRIAKVLNIHQPERVRIVVRETFPLPDDAELRAEAEASGMGSEDARTMGDAILLKPYLHEDPYVIAHELVHVAQHDRLGREVFMRRYLTELDVLGYDSAPLEVEAYQQEAMLVSKSVSPPP